MTESRAILIGTSRYDHGLDPIPAVAANLADLADLLTGVGGAFTDEHCVTVADPDRTTDVGDAVGRAAREATGVLLVYYAGHGLLDRRGRLHLTVTGSDPDRIRWTSVPFETLREEILDSPARVRILILDCCFAGRAFEAMADVPGLVAGQTELRGTYTIASSEANEPSFAPAGHRNTAFTGALLAAVSRAPGSTLEEVFQEAERVLRRDGYSRPRRRSIDVAGEMRLFGQPRREHGYLRAAEAGDVAAMNRLGILLHNRGEIAEAENWYRRAADEGLLPAIYNLATLLHDRGEIAEAENWFRHAADRGHPEAVYNLGTLLHDRGEIAEAENWYRRAADGGHPEAMNGLGFLLHNRGEMAQAETWFRHAADKGQLNAMYNLGTLLHHRGEIAEAENWYRRAADGGHPEAVRQLGFLRDQHGEQQPKKRWPWSASS